MRHMRRARAGKILEKRHFDGSSLHLVIVQCLNINIQVCQTETMGYVDRHNTLFTLHGQAFAYLINTLTV